MPVGWGSVAWYLARLHRLCGDEAAAARSAASAGPAPTVGAGAWGPPLERPARLSAREEEVLWLVAEGLTNKAIAAALHLSVHTVERHVVNVLGKVGAANRGGATAWAHARGLVD